MARVAQTRDAASPISPRQAARRAQILDAAAALGSGADYDRVQMADIAKAAGVALGTLYRYFPSKTHLFAALFQDRIARFVGDDWSRTGADRAAVVGANLAALNRSLLADPRLCSAMLRATAAGYMNDLPADTLWLESESALTQAILDTVGITEPKPADHGVVLLLVYSWWGVLASSLSSRMSAERAERELRTAATLLLAGHTR
ncbi:TetR/AcrR family transcriptional regulator [Nocardia arizonensis]|uniref:TetR/AcrR family transcriptional regulator n=1 Tax=Nocardia arizonensis TaxID=1141647 RepID=UPI000B06B783|nr:TetR/AcrR family transcriptional regulator [Nocardia arizonensis]